MDTEMQVVTLPFLWEGKRAASAKTIVKKKTAFRLSPPGYKLAEVVVKFPAQQPQILRNLERRPDEKMLLS